LRQKKSFDTSHAVTAFKVMIEFFLVVNEIVIAGMPEGNIHLVTVRINTMLLKTLAPAVIMLNST